MNAQRFLPALCILPLMLYAAQAQTPRRIVTGKNPAYLFAEPAKGHVHAITAGTDLNFNGVFEADSGDLAPRWYVIDAATEQIVDSMAFDRFFSSFPPRFGVDLAGQRLYVAQSGRVRSFNIGTLELDRDTVVLGNYAAVTFDSTAGRLVLSQRPGFSDPGNVVIVNAATGDTAAIVRTGINPSMSPSMGYGNGGEVAYFTLNEGTFGVPNSSISFTGLAQDVYNNANGQPLGGGGSFLVSRGDRAYFVLGGGQKIHVVNTQTHLDLPFSPIVTAPTGQNGPRTLAFQGDSVLLVGMYSGNLLRVATESGTILDTIRLGGRIEALAVHDSLAFAALRTTVNGNPDSSIIVVNLNTGKKIDTAIVGVQPLALFVANNGDIHAIGYGTNDSTHWWTVLDPATRAVKSTHVLSGSLEIPQRLYYDTGNDSLYIALSDTLRAFSASAPNGGSRVIYAGGSDSTYINAVADGGEYLFINEVQPIGKVGHEYVHVITRGGEHIARFTTGARPTMAARVTTEQDKAVSLYVLNRGAQSSQRSTLDLFEFRPDILAPDTLGSGANHLSFYDEVGLVTMNGAHSVTTFNVGDWRIGIRIPTQTTGFDGPRETLLLPGDSSRLLVTTYAGDVRVITETGFKIYPTGGKAEGITMVNNKVFVANVFAPDYTADSTVVVFDATSLVASVERVDAVASATTLEQNYPNPVSAGTVIRFTIPTPGRVTLSLYSTSGEKMTTLIDREMEAGSYNTELRAGELPSGSYIYTLQSGSTVLSKVMKVVR